MRPAFDEKERGPLVRRITAGEVARLERLEPEVPRDLATIVHKAIERDPAHRYRSARELADDLRRFVEDQPIRARRMSPLERASRWCRRNRGLAASIGMAAGAMVAAVGFSLLYAKQQRELAAARKLYVDEVMDHMGKQAVALTTAAAAEKRTKIALADSRRRMAMLDLERGRSAFDKGQVGEGMLWTLEALRMADEAGDPALKRVALANLSAWRHHHIEPRQVFNHGEEVTAVALSPDGRTLLTAGRDRAVRRWEVATGRAAGPALVHRVPVSSVATSPDGRMILTRCVDRSAWLWDAVSGEPVPTPLGAPDTVSFVAFNPDGRMIVVVSTDHTVRLWATASRQPAGPPLSHPDSVNWAVFSPDGRTIVTGGGDRTARRWDVATGRLIGPPLSHSEAVWCAVFSPDGRTIVTGGGDRTARRWAVTTGRQVGPPLMHDGPVYRVAFSPDGRTILTASSDRMARLWDADTGRPVGPPLMHPNEVVAAAFSPDGRTVSTVTIDETARLWDVATGRALGPPLIAALGLPFGPEGRSLVTRGHDGLALLWEVDLGEPIGALLAEGSREPDDELELFERGMGEPPGPPFEFAFRGGAVAFSPDGRTLLVDGCDGRVWLWDVDSGERLDRRIDAGAAVLAAAWSPDGRTVLTLDRNGQARRWDAATGRALCVLANLEAGLRCAAFSPGGRAFGGGADFGSTAWLRDASTGEPLGRPMDQTSAVWSLAFSPDGRTILAGNEDKTARLWDVATGQPAGPPLVHPNWVRCVAFSPDGRMFLTGCLDGKARLWDSAGGRPHGPPMSHPAGVTSVAFSPDGRTIAVGCEDRTAQLWDADSVQPIGPALRHPSAATGLLRVAFRPDGRSVLTSDLATVRLWELPGPLPDDFPRLSAWVEAATGLEIDERGSTRELEPAAWLERRRRIERLGGPPPADPVPRLDPIVHGPDPSARGDALARRGLLDAAEAAYAEAFAARPFNEAVRERLVQLQAERGRLDRAAATLAVAVRRMPGDVELRRRLGLALLGSGDRAAWRRSNARLLDRFGGTQDPATARQVAWACVQGSGGTDDPEAPIRLAEVAVRAEDDPANALNTLGAALPRRPVGAGEPPAREGGAGPRRYGPSRQLGIPGDGPSPTRASRSGAALARPAEGVFGQQRPRLLLERAGDPPAAERGRGRGPLRPGVPRRSVRAVEPDARNAGGTTAGSRRPV